VRDYIFASLMYYACYAVISVFMLLVISRPWWQTVLGLVLVAGISYFVMRTYAKRNQDQPGSVDVGFRVVSWLFFVTVIQAIDQVAIYAVELHTVNPHITLGQAITYTGAANFALFVALTPGAIGIRESFLLFSERLHHVSTSNIVAANLIDRAVFLIFLAMLFLLTISFHARSKLGVKKLYESQDAKEKQLRA